MLLPALASFFVPASPPPSFSDCRCRWSTFSAPSFSADRREGLELVRRVFLRGNCPQTESCFCSRSSSSSFVDLLRAWPSPWGSTVPRCQLPGGGIKRQAGDKMSTSYQIQPSSRTPLPARSTASSSCPRPAPTCPGCCSDCTSSERFFYEWASQNHC